MSRRVTDSSFRAHGPRSLQEKTPVNPLPGKIDKGYTSRYNGSDPENAEGGNDGSFQSIIRHSRTTEVAAQ
jgi:hypothetical protein